MKRAGYFVCGWLCFVVLFSACGSKPKQPPVVSMVYFYDNPCASCDEEGKFEVLLQQQTQDLQGIQKYTLRCVNTFQEGYAERDAVAAENGMADISRSTPLLCVGNYVLAGDEIAQYLRQFYWQAVGLGSSDRVTEYYYRDNCPDCMEIAEQMQVFLANPAKTVVKICTENPQTKIAFRELMEANNIPKEKYQIPYLIENRKHYSGAEEILRYIDD